MSISANFLKKLTTKPGIYKMLDSGEHVLYVGKAANLKTRVSSYFKTNSSDIKTQALIKQVVAIEVIVTRSENEALLLESSIIKTLRPKYNVLLRDDKSYPYLHVSSNHPYPRMEILRFKKKPETGKLFGPYPAAANVREALNIIQKVFKLRNCSDIYFSGRKRPCLQYQINRCSAPCTKYISIEEYQQSVNDAIRFLQGKSPKILNELVVRMDEAVARLDFEQAARIRDQIKSLRLVQEQQSVIKLEGDLDVIVLEARTGFACVQWVTIRSGKILANQQIYPKVPTQNLMGNVTSDELWQEVFRAFLAYFYVDTPERIPPLILTNHKVQDKEIWQETLTKLRGKKCIIQQNPRKDNARWVDFAENNLRVALEDKYTSNIKISERFEALRQLIKRNNPIKRMECFDISHIQGSNTVASCVVFDDSGPLKSDYRKYNIKGIIAGDDYAAMEQVLTRRFKKLAEMEHIVPDLVIIDGGKGQLKIAVKILDELNLPQISLLGIAKGVSRKAGLEKLIIKENDIYQEISLPPDSKALHLLQQIRDEAHRFAITFHRQKRQKQSLESSLETIEGIGKKRRKALLTRFGGLRDLSKSSVEEICKVEGISKNMAQKIFEYFNGR